jgi:hypothetical protein
MDPIVPISFIVIVAIVMGGLVKISRQWRPEPGGGRRG